MLSFSETSCSFPNMPVPTLTEVKAYENGENSNRKLWDIYSQICFIKYKSTQNIVNNYEFKNVSEIEEASQDTFSVNYSKFLQLLLINIINNCISTNEEDYYLNSLLYRFIGISFFTKNLKDEVNFYYDRDTGNTVLTALSLNEKVGIANKALFQDIINQACIAFLPEKLIEFLVHKNNSNISCLQAIIEGNIIELLESLLSCIKNISEDNKNLEVLEFFFKRKMILKNGNEVSLMTLLILYSDESLLNHTLKTIEYIFYMKNDFFFSFIENNNLVPHPLLLAVLLNKKQSFRILIEKVKKIYQSEPAKYIEYLSQNNNFNKNSIIEIISIPHLLIKLNQKEGKSDIVKIIEPLLGEVYNWVINYKKQKKNLRYVDIFYILMDVLINYSNYHYEAVFDYYTAHNLKGQTILHLLNNDDVVNNTLVTDLIDTLNVIFHKKNYFSKILNYRDYDGYTPFLLAKSNDDKSEFLNILKSINDVDQQLFAYDLFSDINKTKLGNKILLINVNWIKNFPVSCGRLDYTRLQKETLFSLAAFLFNNTNAYALIDRVEKIFCKFPEDSVLSINKKAQLKIYREAVDNFYSYISLNHDLLESAIYPQNFNSSLESLFKDIFIIKKYQYLIVQKSSQELILIGRNLVNYFIFSYSLLSPLKPLYFNYNDKLDYIAYWVKNYFFLTLFKGKSKDNLLNNNDYVLYPFNITKINDNYTEFLSYNLSINFHNYVENFNRLNFSIILDNELFLNKKLEGIFIKYIQRFFLIDHKFISINMLKDNFENFFSKFNERITFRIELLEEKFFNLNKADKQALQLIFKKYPSIDYEPHQWFFDQNENLKEYLTLQKIFLFNLSKYILNLFRSDDFILSEWTHKGFVENIMLAFSDTTKDIQIDRINESEELYGREKFLNFLFKKKIPKIIETLSKNRILKRYIYIDKILFIALSSLPFGIKALAKISSHSIGYATSELLNAVAPWVDLATPSAIEHVLTYLPKKCLSSFDKLLYQCPNCILAPSDILKNFPIFSIFILTKSLIDTIEECDSKQKASLYYCINMITNIISTYTIEAVNIIIPEVEREKSKETILAFLVLIIHNLGTIAIFDYWKLHNNFNLSGIGFLTKTYLLAQTGLGSLTINNFNYATVGIQNHLIFSAFEKFIDDHARKYSLDYNFVAITLPGVIETTEFITDSGKNYPVFKVKYYSNVEFIFTKNQSFCHDTSAFQIMPEHRDEFYSEYNFFVGTFIELIDENKCIKGEYIQAPFLAITNDHTNAIILKNNRDLVDRKHLLLSSTNYYFGLIDPATIMNYTWTFEQDIEQVTDKQLIGFIVKRILILEENKKLHIARIKIGGSGLARDDFNKNTYSINFGFHSHTFGTKTKVIIEPSEETLILQSFSFFSSGSLIKPDVYYFDRKSINNRKGMEIINLDRVKNFQLELTNQYLSSEGKIIDIPCEQSFKLINSGLGGSLGDNPAVKIYPGITFSRKHCDIEKYPTTYAYHFGLSSNMRFIYNQTLKVTSSFFNTSIVNERNLLLFHLEPKMMIYLPNKIVFPQIKVIKSDQKMILEYNLDDDFKPQISFELSESNPNFFEQKIYGFWSSLTSYKESYLEFSKIINQSWRVKLYTQAISDSLLYSKIFNFRQLNYDEIFFSIESLLVHFIFTYTGFHIEGNFTEYEYDISQAFFIFKEYGLDRETRILTPKKINYFFINNVLYYINNKTYRLLAIKVNGVLEKPLLAPLRITENFVDHARKHPINYYLLNKNLIKFLQFDDCLVSVKYFNYYQFITNTSMNDFCLYNLSYCKYKSSMSFSENLSSSRHYVQSSNYFWWIATILGISLFATGATVLFYRYKMAHRTLSPPPTSLEMMAAAALLTPFLPKNTQAQTAKLVEFIPIENLEKVSLKNESFLSSTSMRVKSTNYKQAKSKPRLTIQKVIQLNDSTDPTSNFTLIRWCIGYLFGKRSFIKRINQVENLSHRSISNHLINDLSESVIKAIDRGESLYGKINTDIDVFSKHNNFLKTERQINSVTTSANFFKKIITNDSSFQVSTEDYLISKLH